MMRLLMFCVIFGFSFGAFANASNTKYNFINDYQRSLKSMEDRKLIQGSSSLDAYRNIGQILVGLKERSEEWEKEGANMSKEKIEAELKRRRMSSCMGADLLGSETAQNSWHISFIGLAAKERKNTIDELRNEYAGKHYNFLATCKRQYKNLRAAEKSARRPLPKVAGNCPPENKIGSPSDGIPVKGTNTGTAFGSFRKLNNDLDTGFYAFNRNLQANLGQNKKSIEHFKKVQSASCNGFEAGAGQVADKSLLEKIKENPLRKKASGFIRKNKMPLLLIGGALLLNQQKNKDKEKAAAALAAKEKAELQHYIDNCSQASKVNGGLCRAKFRDTCMADSTGEGCAEYTTALCGEPGQQAPGSNSDYCVVQGTKSFCADGANPNSPSCQWMSQLAESCKLTPHVQPCWPKFESIHTQGAICQTAPEDPLCKHLMDPSGIKMVNYDPAGGIGSPTLDTDRAIASVNQPGSDVLSSQAALFQTSSVRTSCLTQQLVNCGLL